MGNMLVAFQWGLLFWLAVLAYPAITKSTVPTCAVVLATISVLLAVWTLKHNRLGNFHISTMPKSSGFMVTSGPYRWIRHPMYMSVFLGAAALGCSVASFMGWATWLVLGVVLWTKARIEERLMLEQHENYANYRQHTQRFVPWLW